MKQAYLFPGQGSQFVGMGRDLYDAFPEARSIFDEADEVLGFRLTQIMFGEGSNDEQCATQLRQTENTQPALYVHSMAAFNVLDGKAEKPVAFAGHSLGEYSALAAAQVISFEDGLRLVRLRGKLMAEAGRRMPGMMAAVLGLDDEIINEICRSVRSETGGMVQPANYNSPGQVVISGDVPTVEEAMRQLKAGGARRVVELPVSGAFHSPLMDFARTGLHDALKTASIAGAAAPVYLNVTASPSTDAAEIRQRLAEQLTAPVKWSQALQAMKLDGIHSFCEIGAGGVLSGLVRRTLGRDADTRTVGTAAEVRSLVSDV